MRFKITMEACESHPILPCNYQYPLSAAVYRILGEAHSTHTQFLHDTGYRRPFRLKGFKLFTFSDLHTPFQIQGDRMYMKRPIADFQICFYLPDVAEHFLKGLFMQQQIDIADPVSRASFTIQQVDLLDDSLPDTPDGVQELMLRPLSPLVVGMKNQRGHYEFLRPDDPAFTQWLKHNWIEKYRAIENGDEQQLSRWISQTEIKPVWNGACYRSRLITIKAFTPQQTRIRGFDRFLLQVRAPRPLLKLALHAGMGLYNAMGMGYVEVMKKNFLSAHRMRSEDIAW